MKVTLETARRFTLEKQGFELPQKDVSKDQVFGVLERLGCVQIDTVNVVERSHYLALWSRLGCYRKELLDMLLYPDRKVFEYWAHALSLIPIEHYRYFLHGMETRRKELRAKAKEYLRERTSLVDAVLAEIKRNGPMCSKDFKHERKTEEKRQSGWWNWKPAKIALELLYGAGVLMLSRRESFQKYYDLTENVLPSHVDTDKPSEEERQTFFLTKTLDAWGLAEPKDIGQYFYAWSTKTNVGVKTLSGLVRKLEQEDVLTSIQIQDVDAPHMVLTKNLEALEEISDKKRQKNTVSFLSPFDNLTWSRSRTNRLFDFHSSLEMYVPKSQRKFGYYVLGILYGASLVGRLDPKMHREKGTMEIRALELKENFKPNRTFEKELDLTLRRFMKFHDAQAVDISEKCPRFLKRIT